MVKQKTIARPDGCECGAGAIEALSRAPRPLPHRHHSERAMVHALIIGVIWVAIK
jgi:hypothetical protein